MNPIRRWRRLVLAFAVAVGAPVGAAKADPRTVAPAGGIEVWASSDSDKTSVVKILGRALWKFDGGSKVQGFDLERAWFTPEGQRTSKQTRVYLDFADSVEQKWQWRARIGTNGKTVLGSASLRSNDWSKEAFLEREVVETPRGLKEGIYYTFAGVSANALSTAQDTLSVMGGLQKFTGRNERLHLRTTFVHVIKPEFGLSLQLRARYFHSTRPGEFDYYSPRDFTQVLPVVQVRRFNRSGWMYLAALGYGVQKATGGKWESARLADLRIESPPSSKKLQAFVQLQYSNNSLVGAAGNYRYVVGRLGLTQRL
jgi:hypothetical protein